MKEIRKIGWIGIIGLFFFLGCEDDYRDQFDEPMNVIEELEKIDKRLDQLECSHDNWPKRYERESYYWDGDCVVNYKVCCDYCGKYLERISEEEYLKRKIKEKQERLKKLEQRK